MRRFGGSYSRILTRSLGGEGGLRRGSSAGNEESAIVLGVRSRCSVGGKYDHAALSF